MYPDMKINETMKIEIQTLIRHDTMIFTLSDSGNTEAPY